MCMYRNELLRFVTGRVVIFFMWDALRICYKENELPSEQPQLPLLNILSTAQIYNGGR